MPRTPIHPGIILQDEVEELGLRVRDLAARLDVPANRLYQIVAGNRNVAADMALRLAQFFGTSAELWMNLQSIYELDLTRRNRDEHYSYQ